MPASYALTITNVTPTGYEVAPSLSTGSTYYIDRTYTLTTIPSILTGGKLIKTANNDKTNTSTSFLSFTVDVNVTVYVAYSQAATTLPAWLSTTSGWTNTGQTLATSDVPLRVYEKNYTAGSITLGGNMASPAQGSTENYVVIVKDSAADTTQPSVTINQASGQVDPTSASPINFTVVFSENVTGFATGDVTLSGTAGATTATVTGSSPTYNVAVSGMTTTGTVIAAVSAGVAQDAAGNPNTASTSTDNTVAFQVADTTQPSVTINQATGQADPTSASPVNFTVVFSENVTGFATGDVTLSGTAGATTATVTGSSPTYNVAVSGMTTTGTVIAAVPAGVAQDAAGNLNTASTSTDGTVTFSSSGSTQAWQFSGNDTYYNYNNGKVGIGTVSPQATLDVHGVLTNATNGTGWGLKVRDLSTVAAGVGGGIIFQGNKSAASAAGNFAAIEGAKENATESDEAGQMIFYTTPQSTQLLTERMRIDSIGNVGIGTASPANLLTVRGANEGLRFVNSSSGDKPWLIQQSGNDFLVTEVGIGNRVSFQAGGNVGIGTTSPSANLHVADIGAGDDSRSKLLIGTGTPGLLATTNLITSDGLYALGVWDNNDLVTPRFLVTRAGNVGIGTANPGGRLHVIGASYFAHGALPNSEAQFPGSYAPIEVTTASTSGDRPYYSLHSGNNTAYQLGIAGTSFVITNGGGATTYNLFPAEVFRVTPSGYVGLGTPTPTERLHVVGNATFTGTVSGGNIIAHYQDVAEWVPAPIPMPAGTVVVLDTAQNNQVIASSHPYDTKVAGVISSMPGLLLGIEGEGKVKVATTGRVKVKADASKGPIKVGDLLVTSDKPGVAMRSEPIEIQGRQIHSPGTIIGKALEPLASGEGEILVLLSLQ